MAMASAFNDLSSLSVSVLKNKCRELGLTVGGKKADLVTRIENCAMVDESALGGVLSLSEAAVKIKKDLESELSSVFYTLEDNAASAASQSASVHRSVDSGVSLPSEEVVTGVSEVVLAVEDVAPAAVAPVAKLTIETVEVGGQYEGTVKAVSEYGAFVNFGLVNQNGLVHKSQLAHEYVTNPTDYVSVGQKVSVRVLTVDLGMKKISLSMKPKTPAKLTIETMEVGSLYEGIVIRVSNVGAFVDLGSTYGLVHKSNLSHKFVANVADYVSVGQKVSVRVLSVDLDKRQSSLSMKSEAPVEKLTIETIEVGGQYEGIVKSISGYGAFVAFGPNRYGLVHKKQLADEIVANVADVVSIGQKVSVRVLSVDLDKKKIALTMKSEDPELIEDSVEVGGGTVKIVSDISPFVDVGDITAANGVFSLSGADDKIKTDFESELSSIFDTLEDNAAYVAPQNAWVRRSVDSRMDIQSEEVVTRALGVDLAVEDVASAAEAPVAKLSLYEKLTKAPVEKLTIETVEVGRQYEGTLKDVSDIGAFVDVGLTNEFNDLSSLTVSVLKNKCRELGLTVGGKKADLVTRIENRARGDDTAANEDLSLSEAADNVKTDLESELLSVFESLQDNAVYVAPQSASVRRSVDSRMALQSEEAVAGAAEVALAVEDVASAAEAPVAKLSLYEKLTKAPVEKLTIETVEVGGQYEGTLKEVSDIGAFVDDSLTNEFNDLPLFTASPLKNKGRDLGLTVGGKKADLVARIEDRAMGDDTAANRDKMNEDLESELSSVFDTLDDNAASAASQSASVRRSVNSRMALQSEEAVAGAAEVDLAVEDVASAAEAPVEKLTIETIEVGDQYEGTVKVVSEFGAFVNFGLVNQNGLVYKSELADELVANVADFVSVGQTVSVRVLFINLEKKQIALTMKSEAPVAKLTIESIELGGQYEGTVKVVSEFGAFVDFGLENQNGLVHKSQLADEFVADVAEVVSVGQTVSVRVLSVDLDKKKISLSMKSKAPIVKQTIDKVEVGGQYEGIVKGVSSFGAFVDFGLTYGLVHKSQLAGENVANPADVVSVGQRVSVRVLSVDLDKKKIALTMKSEVPVAKQTIGTVEVGRQNKEIARLVTNPADIVSVGQKALVRVLPVDLEKRQRSVSTKSTAPVAKLTIETVEVGSQYEGRVAVVSDLGAFVEIGHTYGLVHKSELAYEYVDNPADYVSVGQKVSVRVLSVDLVKKQTSLTMKSEDPGKLTIQTIQVGRQYEGIVKGVQANVGAFVAFGPNRNGFVRKSQLADEFVADVAEVVSVGQKVFVRVLFVDLVKNKILLSMKSGTVSASQERTPRTDGPDLSEYAAMQAEEVITYLSSFTETLLRNKCRELGLRVGGKKADLVTRIKEHRAVGDDNAVDGV